MKGTATYKGEPVKIIKFTLDANNHYALVLMPDKTLELPSITALTNVEIVE